MHMGYKKHNLPKMQSEFESQQVLLWFFFFFFFGVYKHSRQPGRLDFLDRQNNIAQV